MPKAAEFASLRCQLRNDLQEEKEPFVLFGLSLGGVLALSFASQLPQCRGVIVSGAHYRLKGNHLFGLQIAVMALLPSYFYRQQGLDKAQLLALQKSMRQLDLTKEVREITLPTLLLCGSRDKVNLKPIHEMRERMIDAECVIIEGGGHELNVHKPEELAHHIRQFLERHVHEHN